MVHWRSSSSSSERILFALIVPHQVFIGCAPLLHRMLAVRVARLLPHYACFATDLTIAATLTHHQSTPQRCMSRTLLHRSARQIGLGGLNWNIIVRLYGRISTALQVHLALG